MNPGKLTVATRKEDFLKKSPFVEAINLVTIGLTITSMVLAITAFTLLKKVTSDVSFVLDNWSSPPIVDVKTVPRGAPCPSNFYKLGYGGAFMPKLAKGSCACTDTANGLTNYISTVGNCSDAAEKSGQCHSDFGIERLEIKHWRKKDICFAKAASGSVVWSKHGPPKYVRPEPENGVCPPGYKKCGAGVDYEKDKATCTKVAEMCPFTSIIVADASTVFPSNNPYTLIPNTTLDNGYAMFGRRGEIPGELPIVDLRGALTEIASTTTAYPVESETDKRGICYGGSRQMLTKVTATPISSSTSASLTYTSSSMFPKSCRKSDNRFDRVDSMDLESFMLDSIEVDVPDCVTGGLPLYAKSSSRYIANNDPDYYNSFVYGRSGYQYAVSTSTLKSSTCLSSDYICQNVYRQTLCGKYVHLARSFGSETKKFGIYSESEVYWEPTCPADKGVVNDQNSVLLATIAAQMGVLIISVICGFFGGFIVPVYVLMKHWKYVKYEETHDRPELEEYVAPPLSFFKVIPLIAAMIFVSRIYRVYQELGKNDCSDATSNETFDFLAKQLPAIYQNSIGNITVDCVLLAYSFYCLMAKKVSSDALFKNTRIDSYGRKLLEFGVPQHKADKGLKVQCFCATYEFSLPESIGEGMKVYIYEDGEVWGSIDGRQMSDVVGNPQGVAMVVAMAGMGNNNANMTKVMPISYAPLATASPTKNSMHPNLSPQQMSPQPQVYSPGQQGYPTMPMQQQGYPQATMPMQQQGYPQATMPMQPQGYPQPTMPMQQQGYPQQQQGYPQAVTGMAQGYSGAPQGGFVSGYPAQGQAPGFPMQGQAPGFPMQGGPVPMQGGPVQGHVVQGFVQGFPGQR